MVRRCRRTNLTTEDFAAALKLHQLGVRLFDLRSVYPRDSLADVRWVHYGEPSTVYLSQIEEGQSHSLPTQR